jgi:hypothetical protein
VSSTSATLSITTGTVSLSLTSLVAPAAANITVADSGNFYTATEVESALAEIFATPSTTTRRVVELATDAEALARTDAQRAVTPANLSQFTTLQRYNAQRFMPTGAQAQTMSRADGALAVFPLSSGRQSFQLAWLPAGTYNSITFISSGNAAVSPTNQWFSIYNATTLAKVAVTNDDTTTAWAAQTAKTLTISGGVTITEGLYYIGVMVAAGTPPSLYGYPAGNAVVHGIAPIMAGPDTVNTGLTTPATAPSTCATPSGSANALYAYVS